MPDRITEVVCRFEEHHPDMYPEFAPDPIVIACKERATVFVEVSTASDPDRFRTVTCLEHARMILEDVIGDRGQGLARVLGDEDRRQFVTGWNDASAVEMTPRQAMIVCHEDVGAAELATPEYGHELYDLGWELRIEQRAAAIYEDHDLHDEPGGAW